MAKCSQCKKKACICASTKPKNDEIDSGSSKSSTIETGKFVPPPFQTSTESVPMLSQTENNETSCMEAIEPDVTMKNLLVGNIGSNITNQDLRDFFDLDKNEFTKRHSSVQLEVNDRNQNVARICIPNEL